MDDLELSDETLAAMADAAGTPADFAGVAGQAKMFYTEWRPLPMNAKELHDLYAPLWAAVPETRPRRSYCGDDAPLCFLAGWGWGELAAAEVDEDAAAALCRVTAEDWLVANMRTFDNPRRCDRLEMFRDGDSTELIIWPAWPTMKGDTPVSKSYRGPTIHHALVAACLAIHASSSPTSAPSPQLPHPPA